MRRSRPRETKEEKEKEKATTTCLALPCMLVQQASRGGGGVRRHTRDQNSEIILHELMMLLFLSIHA
jgi:hypothetical protein